MILSRAIGCNRPFKACNLRVVLEKKLLLGSFPRIESLDFLLQDDWESCGRADSPLSHFLLPEEAALQNPTISHV